MNLYSENIRDWEHHLLDFWPDPGDYSLELQLIGKDQRSTGKLLGIEAVRLRERRPRVSGFAYDKNRNWRTDPVLYE